MQDHTPEAGYQHLRQTQISILEKLNQKRRRLGWARFLVFILTLAIAYKVFVSFGIAGMLVVATGFGILLFLISLDVNNNQAIRHTQTLIRVNEEELRVLRYDYHHHFDGSDYLPLVHDYANDLDLFGKASLFQYINRCYTEQGRDLLANNLLHPLPVAVVLERQEAIRELTPLVAWRQELQALSMQTTLTTNTQNNTANWLAGEEHHFKSKAWKPFVLVYSFITLGSALAAILGYIPSSIFSLLYLLYFITALMLSRNAMKPYVVLSGIVKEIGTAYQLMHCIEGRNFQSARLQRMQAEAGSGQEKASVQIRTLKKILDRFDLRVSIVGLLFFNAFLLWDVRQMIALNQWRQRNRTHLSRWFSLIAEMEVLHSLATLQYNQPSWCLPGFKEEHFYFEGKELGHPLIPTDKRVNNDFTLEGKAKIGLVTGSNMAGKSTFLRSLGVNVVLAQAGSPVCATQMVLSPVRLMSSMRIADNLAENTSTFYAELKKLKTIIEAVNLHDPVFILLDEILRGTNSFDRHTGSAALITQLIRERAVAVIATHDLELAGMQERFPSSVENYHFDVQVAEEELYFDYRLKHGVCTSMNASILMKKIGIELEA